MKKELEELIISGYDLHTALSYIQDAYGDVFLKFNSEHKFEIINIDDLIKKKK